MFFIRALWFPRVEIRIQILKTIDIRKNVSQHCENAKERKAHVDKIALYMELWSAFSVFVLPAKVAGLFWKTNEAKKWDIIDAFNVLVWQLYVSFRTCYNEKPINVAISRENFASYSILFKFALFFGLFHTYAFVLVVSAVLCVFSGKTDFWAFSLKAIESGCKIILSFKKKAWF